MSRSRALGISRVNVGSAEDGVEVAQEGKTKSSQDLLRKCSLLTWPSFLGTFTKSRRAQGVSYFRVLTFEPLYTLYPRISKSTEECAVIYLSSNKLRTREVQKKEVCLLKNVAVTPRVHSFFQRFQE